MKNARTHNKADSGALDKRDSTELVLTTSAEPRVDSRLLAKQLGGDHANVFELVTNYRADFEQLGVVRFQTEKPMPAFTAGAGRHQLRKFRNRPASSKAMCRKLFPHIDQAAHCNAGQRRGTIRTKAKAPVTEKHLIRSGCSPHRKAGFCLAQILGTGALASVPHGYGWGGVIRKDARTTSDVFFTPRPPAAMKTQTVALVTPEGAKTMTVSTTASPSAAPTTQATEETRAFALLQATSDATMAKLYLSRGNIAAARRKAVQLLKALQSLEVTA